MSGETAPARNNVRRAALKILGRMNIPAGGGPSDGYSNILVDSYLKNNPDLADADRALLSVLVSGVCERIVTLDWVIAALSSRPPEKLDHDVLDLLRLGLWQLGYADRIPPHAAVNETVSLAKRSAPGFVNAILRSYIRKKDGIKLPEGASARALSVRYSVNAELCERFIKEFGAERTESVLAAFFERRGTDLRVNTLKTDEKELSRELEAEGFSFEVTPGGKTIRNLRGRGLPAAKGGLSFRITPPISRPRRSERGRGCVFSTSAPAPEPKASEPPLICGTKGRSSAAICTGPSFP